MVQSLHFLYYRTFKSSTSHPDSQGKATTSSNLTFIAVICVQINAFLWHSYSLLSLIKNVQTDLVLGTWS